MKKNPTGRPRLYDSTSEKVDAFRKRQEASGYLRKEVLVTLTTWDRVTELAKQYGVSASDAASGLLENGLRTFEQSQNEIPAFSRKMPSSSPSTSPQPPSIATPNPIQDFFAKRREVLQSNANTKGTPEEKA